MRSGFRSGYRRAAPLLIPSAEPIEIEIDDTSIPAYLRLPAQSGAFPCAVLIGGFHGEQDWLIPVDEAYKLRDVAVNASQTVVIPPDAIHCGHNISERIRTPMADWLAHQLHAQ